MRTLARILVLSLAAVLAGCGGAASSPSATAAPSISGLPTPSAVPAMSPSPALAGWAADSAAAMDELVAAIGNPDVGSKSEAFEAFEAALASPDPSAIGPTADVVLGRLASARALLAPYVGADEVATGARDLRARGIAPSCLTLAR